MADASSKARVTTTPPRRDLDERHLARMLSRGLPVVTIAAALIGGVFGGVSLAILLLAGGTLLGVIALFWASLRVLSGEAPLPAELASAEPASRTDALSARKKMLVRALKDLDNERELGRLEDDDYAQLSQSYRDELKTVLRAMDEALAPYRAKAIDAARRHLEDLGKDRPGNEERPEKVEGDDAPTDAPEKDAPTDAPEKDDAPDAQDEAPQTSRVTCAACETSNEPDARFCKGCGANLAPHADEKAEDEKATSP